MKEKVGSDVDELYEEMLELVNDKNKRDIILNTLQVKLDKKPIKILYNEFTETDKMKLRELLLRSIRLSNNKLILKFHNCSNCKYYIEKNSNEEYNYNKPCNLFTRTIRNGLYYNGLKCKFFEQYVIEVK